MTGKQLKSRMRLSHRWVGVAAAAVLLVTSATGVLLQHPSWLGPPGNPPLAVTVDPLDPDRMLRGTHWGVELSVDAGATWREIPMLAPPTDVTRIIFSPDDPLAVHALGADALVVSRDGGRIWQDIPVGISFAPADGRGIAHQSGRWEILGLDRSPRPVTGPGLAPLRS